MKKLIIAAVAAMLGVAANAAACSWTVGKIYTPSESNLAPNPSTGTLLSSGTVTLYYTLALDGASTEWVTLDQQSLTSGSVGKTQLFDASTIPADISSAGSAYFKAIVTTTIGGADYTLELYTGKNTSPASQSFATLGKTAVTLSFTGVTSNTESKEWTVSVPEPTSGLLLVLGMAGLALRRRRA